MSSKYNTSHSQAFSAHISHTLSGFMIFNMLEGRRGVEEKTTSLPAFQHCLPSLRTSLNKGSIFIRIQQSSFAEKRAIVHLAPPELYHLIRHPCEDTIRINACQGSFVVLLGRFTSKGHVDEHETI